jgi:hypothetical protein
MNDSNLTVLCQLNKGCMGCCGHDFTSKEKIQLAIKFNTIEFEQINPKVKAQFIKFRDRAHPADLRDGVCRNLIAKDGQIFCPLHPTLHQGEDLRIKHCDVRYLCKAAKEFSQWDKDKQDKFLKFISSKKLDNLDYSILMDNNELLEEFEKKKRT